MAYLHLKFGDDLAEVEGVMNDCIAKNGSKTLVVPTAQTTNGMAVKFSRHYPFIKSGLFWRIFESV